MPLYVLGFQQWLNQLGIQATVTEAHYIAMGKHVIDGNLIFNSSKGLRNKVMPYAPTKKNAVGYGTAIEEAANLVSQLGTHVGAIRSATYPVRPIEEGCKYCTFTNLCRKHHWGTLE